MTDQVKPASILIPELEGGVVFISGQRGLGKTTLAVRFDRPELVALLDFDFGKGKLIAKQLNLGYYEDMVARATTSASRPGRPPWTGESMYTIADQIIRNLPAGQFKVAVIDNISNFEEGLRWEVGERPTLHGVNAKHAANGTYGGVNPGVQRLIGGYVSMLHAKGIELVVAVAHVSAPWHNNQPVLNKYRPKGSDIWQTMSVLTLMLVPSATPGSKTPAAIVFKEGVGRQRFNEVTLDYEAVPVLPDKLPEATVKAIRHYIQVEPADRAHPRAEEVVTDEELATYGEKYTREQLAQIMATQEPDEIPFQAIAINPAEVKAAMEAVGDKPRAVAEEMSRRLGREVKIGEISQYLTSNGGG